MSELHHRWNAYRTRVLRHQVSDSSIQVVECRRAWWAGAAAIAELLQRLDENTVLSDFEKKRSLQGFIAEIRAFQGDVAAGRA